MSDCVYSALHPGSALNQRTLNLGTTVLDLEFKWQKSKIGNRVLPGFRELKAVDRPRALYPRTTVLDNPTTSHFFVSMKNVIHPIIG